MLDYLVFRKLGLILAETCVLVACVLLAFFPRMQRSPVLSWDAYLIVQNALIIALVFQFFFHLRDVYAPPKGQSMGPFVLCEGQAFLLASEVLCILYYMFPGLGMEQRPFLLSLGLIAIFLLSWRALLRSYFVSRRPRSNVLVLGTGRLARELVEEVLRHPEYGYRVSGFISDEPGLVGVSIVNPRVLGVYSELSALISKHKIDRIVVEQKDRRGKLPVAELLDLKTQGVTIEDATSFYERISGKIAIENLKPSWMIFNSGFQIFKRQLIQKQLLSVVVSLILIVFFPPIFLLVAILIKLDSPGPIFYRQKRVGQGGRIFTMWKFRSMRKDAESGIGPVWAEENDPRVTRVGRWLRKLRLDELPQLYNIIRGDMTLVGPRPERPNFVDKLEKTIPFFSIRRSVKPGITGWAQINSGYSNTVELTKEKLQHDLFYIKNMSWFLDAFIIFQTIKIVLTGKKTSISPSWETVGARDSSNANIRAVPQEAQTGYRGSTFADLPTQTTPFLWEAISEKLPVGPVNERGERTKAAGHNS
jgi:sugar transferase (PEP-CTERM system associated)